MRGLFFLAILTASLWPSAASALSYCAEPSAPSCLTSYGDWDEYEFDSCKIDMESYKSEVESYISCLSREADDAADEYRDAVKKFNCRAEGNSIC